MHPSLMHPATTLILARMESHPEEFAPTTTRWGTIMIHLSEIAPKDEWNIIKARYDAIRMDSLHREIMHKLFRESKPAEDAETPQQLSFEGF